MGKNTWVKKRREEDGDLDEEESSGERTINIGGKATVWMGKGDKLLIETPGGGAWGATPTESQERGTEYLNVWEPRGSVAERAATQASF
jgi:5-oxoprolinase (ATP-hydrolysing)